MHLSCICSPTLLHSLKFCDDADAIAFLRSCKRYYGLRSLYTIKQFVMGEQFAKLCSFRITKVDISDVKQLAAMPRTVDKVAFSHCFTGDFTEPLAEGIVYLSFHSGFNQVLQKRFLPQSLTAVDFGYFFNQDIAPELLPQNLQYLTLSTKFDKPINAGDLPSSLRFLRLGWNYNRPIHPGSLPAQLRYLHFGDLFNQPILPGTLPHSITELTFGRCFNQPILELPESLDDLTFGTNFNQPLHLKCFPNFVTCVAIGAGFKQSLFSDILCRIGCLQFK